MIPSAEYQFWCLAHVWVCIVRRLSATVCCAVGIFWCYDGVLQVAYEPHDLLPVLYLDSTMSVSELDGILIPVSSSLHVQLSDLALLPSALGLSGSVTHVAHSPSTLVMQSSLRW